MRRERDVQREYERQARREFREEGEFFALGADREIQSDVVLLQFARLRLQLRRVGQTPLRLGAARETEQSVLRRRMAHSRLLLVDCERAFVQSLALLVLARGAVSVGEVVEVRRDARVFLSESLLGEI